MALQVPGPMPRLKQIDHRDVDGGKILFAQQVTVDVPADTASQ